MHRSISAAIALCAFAGPAFSEDLPPGRRPETYWSDPKVIELAKAITVGDLEKIDKLVAAGADVNARGKNDATPLLWAVARERKDSFQRLLERGADPNTDYPYHGSLLHFFAGAQKSSDWLKLALEHKGDPNLKKPAETSETPIFGAISSRRKASLDMLIKAGADLNHQDNAGETPIIMAAGRNWFDSVYYLLEAGADYRHRDILGFDLAHHVIDTSVDPKQDLGEWREKVVDWLTDKGFDFAYAERRIGEDSGTVQSWRDEHRGRAKRWREIVPKDARDYRLRAAGWLIAKDFEKAKADYTEAIRLDPKSGAAYRRRGDVRFLLCQVAVLARRPHDDEFAKALDDYAAAIELDPGDAQSHLNRAVLWSVKDQDAKAIADCDEALRLEPRFAQAYMRRGKIRSFHALLWPVFGEGRPADGWVEQADKAIADFTDALRVDRLCVDAYSERADAWKLKHEYGKGIEDLSEAIKFRRKDSRLFFQRGGMHQAAGDLDAAIEDFTAAIRLDPSDPAHYYEERAEAWAAKRHYSRAIDDFDEVIRQDPDDTIARQKRREVWNAIGRFDKSLEDLQELVRKHPDDEWTHYYLAMFLASCPDDALRDGRTAGEHARKACELTEWKDATTLSALAAAEAEMRNFKEAVDWQKKAIDLVKGQADKSEYRRRLAQYERGQAYREQPQPANGKQ